MYSNKNINNTNSLVSNTISASTATINNLNVTGNTNFAVGSISQNAINGLITELSDLNHYALITGADFTGPISTTQLTINSNDIGNEINTILTKQITDETNITNNSNSINVLNTKTAQISYNSNGQYTEITNLLVDYYLTTTNLILNNKLTVNSKDISAIQLSYLSNLTSDIQTQINSKQQIIDASVDVYGKNISGDSINVRNYLSVNGVNIPATTLSNLQCMNILNSGSLTTTTLDIHDQIQQAAFSFTGLNTFLQAPNYLGTDTNPPSNAFITRSYVDTQLTTKQPVLNNTVDFNARNCTFGSVTITDNLGCNGSFISASNLSLLRYFDINTSLSNSLNSKQNVIDATTNLNVNSLTANSLVTNASQSGPLFNTTQTIQSGSNSYYISPPTLPIYWSFGSTAYTAPSQGLVLPSSSSSNIPTTANCFINWSIPPPLYGTGKDCLINSCIIEVSYFVQECPVNTGTTQYTNNFLNGNGFISTSTTAGSSFLNSQSVQPTLLATCQYYVLLTASNKLSNLTSIGGATNGVFTSGSTSAGFGVYVKYISGTMAGGNTPNDINGSFPKYGSTYIPVSFLYQNISNKIKIQFQFPPNNNTPYSNTYGSYYVAGYGASVRIVGSSTDTTTPQLSPNNNASQYLNSLSALGRAYLSNS